MLVLLPLFCFVTIGFFDVHRKILSLCFEGNAEHIVQMPLESFPRICRLRILLRSSFLHTIVIRKKHSLAIPARLLFMLLQRFLATASPLRVNIALTIAVKSESKVELVIYDRKKSIALRVLFVISKTE